jgi:hypothetical protein
MSNLKFISLAGLVLTAMIVPFVFPHQSLVHIRTENQSLSEEVRRQAEHLGECDSENNRLSNLIAQVNDRNLSHVEEKELVRLRREVGLMREHLDAVAKSPEESSSWVHASTKTNVSGPALAERKLTLCYLMINACRWFASTNKGQFPTDIAQVASFPSKRVLQPGLKPNIFELVYRGSWADIRKPIYTIVIREKEPWQGEDGKWRRVYGFADGSKLVHASADGNFEAWEAQHTPDTAVNHPRRRKYLSATAYIDPCHEDHD